RRRWGRGESGFELVDDAGETDRNEIRAAIQPRGRVRDELSLAFLLLLQDRRLRRLRRALADGVEFNDRQDGEREQGQERDGDDADEKPVAKATSGIRGARATATPRPGHSHLPLDFHEVRVLSIRPVESTCRA